MAGTDNDHERYLLNRLQGEIGIVIKTLIASPAIAFAVGILAFHAETASPGALKMTGAGASGIEKVTQGCWSSHGSRHCRWYGYVAPRGVPRVWQPRYLALRIL
jgi:hypothetical protein